MALRTSRVAIGRGHRCGSWRHTDVDDFQASAHEDLGSFIPDAACCDIRARVSVHFGRMKLLERITVEPDKCGGRPCIRGMRIRVTDILGMLAEGVSQEEILKDFPYLEPDDVKAALAYAARQADHAVLQSA